MIASAVGAAAKARAPAAGKTGARAGPRAVQRPVRRYFALTVTGTAACARRPAESTAVTVRL